MPTITVSSKTDLLNAIKSASSDTTIVLQSGNYGSLRLDASQMPTLDNGSAINIVSADPNNPAVFSDLYIKQADNLTFDGVTVDYTFTAGSNIWDRAITVLNSDNVTIKNSLIDGDDAFGLSATENGYGSGTGIYVDQSSDIDLTGNTIVNFHRGAFLNRSDGLVVSNNDISDMSSDGLDFSAVQNVQITGNHIHNFNAHPNTTAHMDMIQFFTINQSMPTQNVVISNNVLNSGDGMFTQSIFIRNEAVDSQGAGSAMLYRNFTIENNVIHNAHLHGITLSDMAGVSIKNNTVLFNADSAPDNSTVYVPKININHGVTNATVSNNIATDISGSSWNGSGNVIVQYQSPNQSGYAGNLFVDPFAGGNATITDLQAMPGGAIDGSGAGANLTQFDTTPATPTALILTQSGTELAQSSLAFDASNVFGPGGQISTNGASVSWDFGDGNTGTGLKPVHSFTTSGSFDVTATITLGNGSKVVTTQTVVVSTPDLIVADFDNGASDLSGLSNNVHVGSGVQFVSANGGKAAKLNGSYITYSRTDDLRDNSAFTVTADFRKSNATESGSLINFPGSLVLRVQSDNLQIAVTTTAGTSWVPLGSQPIRDTDWHSVAVTYSNTAGTATVYLDGQAIGSVSGLQGTMQTGNEHHDFHIGNPYGGSGFNGYVDNVAFLSGALSAQDIQNLHSGNDTLSSILGGYLNNPNFSFGTGNSNLNIVGNTSTGTGSTTNTTTQTTSSTEDQDQSTGSSGGEGQSTGSSGGGESQTTGSSESEGQNTGSSEGGSQTTSTSEGGSQTTGSSESEGQNTGSSEGGSQTTGSSEGESQTTGTSEGGEGPRVIDNPDDVIVLQNTKLDEDQIFVDRTSSKISIDVDADGKIDDVVALEGDFSTGEFITTLSPTDTTISFTQHITTLTDQQSVNDVDINGVVSAPYLHGDTSSEFTLTMLDSMANAGFANSLGVYEYDAQGAISDVRVIAHDVTNVSGPISITDVDAGKGLGFFIIQNGYNRLDSALLSSPDLDLTLHKGAIRLADGNEVIKKAKVFVSHDADLNMDGMEHLLSGADPDGSGGLILAFEDQVRNGNNVDDDFQDVVFLIEAGLQDVA